MTKQLMVLLLGGLSLMPLGCTGEDESSADAAGRDAAGGNQASKCTVEVEVQLIFYDVVCYDGKIECDGEVQARSDFWMCDSTDITCTEPDRTTKDFFRYPYHDGSCRFCSSTDDGTRCTPISGECGKETIEHIASGSPETGPHPMVDICDAGLDASADAGGGEDAGVGEDAGGGEDAGVDEG